MDRWQDADDDITPLQHSKGRVARMGIAGFVQAAVSAAEQSAQHSDPCQQQQQQQQQQGIVIINSKREQRAAAAKQAMPPPPAPAAAPCPAAAAPPVPASLPRPAVPPDSLPPPPNTLLLVHKTGALIQQLPMIQVLTVFGRLPCNDVVLDHASISRQHAALTFRRRQQQQSERSQQQQQSLEAVVWDLGSAHGTYINGKRVNRGQLCPVAAGDVVQFGASTRSYSIQLPAAADDREVASSSGQPVAGKKRPRVTFGDADTHDFDGATAGSSTDGEKARALEQAVGYSDGKHFTPRVGPQPVSSDSNEQGKFAHLMKSEVIVVTQTRATAQQQQQQQTVDSLQESIAASDVSQQHFEMNMTDSGLHQGSRQQSSDNQPVRQAEVKLEVSQAAIAFGNGNDQHQQQQQQQTLKASPAAEVSRTWSAGSSRLLLPPQLSRRNSTPASQQERQVQQYKPQQSKQAIGVGSSLYDQLPQAGAGRTDQ